MIEKLDKIRAIIITSPSRWTTPVDLRLGRLLRWISACVFCALRLSFSLSFSEPIIIKFDIKERSRERDMIVSTFVITILSRFLTWHIQSLSRTWQCYVCSCCVLDNGCLMMVSSCFLVIGLRSGWNWTGIC